MYLFIYLCIYLFSYLFIYLFIYVFIYLYIPPIYLILFLFHINPIVLHWLPHESVGSSEGATWNSWQLCGGFCFPDFLIFFIFNHYYLFMPLLCWPGRGGYELIGGWCCWPWLISKLFKFSICVFNYFEHFKIIFHFFGYNAWKELLWHSPAFYMQSGQPLHLQLFLIWTRAHLWHGALFQIKHNDSTLVHTHPFGGVVQLVVPMKNTIHFIVHPQPFQYAQNPQEMNFVHGVQFLECRIRLWLHEPKWSMVYDIYIYIISYI